MKEEQLDLSNKKSLKEFTQKIKKACDEHPDLEYVILAGPKEETTTLHNTSLMAIQGSERGVINVLIQALNQDMFKTFIEKALFAYIQIKKGVPDHEHDPVTGDCILPDDKMKASTSSSRKVN